MPAAILFFSALKEFWEISPKTYFSGILRGRKRLKNLLNSFSFFYLTRIYTDPVPYTALPPSIRASEAGSGKHNISLSLSYAIIAPGVPALVPK